MKIATIFTSLFISTLSLPTYGQTVIVAKDAGKHMNENVVVCGMVYGGKYLSSADITLLDVGGTHPNELLTLVIKGDDRKKFKAPPEDVLKGKNVCITGQVIDYKGKPEIMITDPEQIKEAELGKEN
jgi:DNA/RNA endonuclease YhcR with UshA esterase domain